MKEFLNKIKKYNQIALYRHVNPDLDAYGSLIGMYYLIKDNFPEKRIVVMGELKHNLTDMFFDFDVEQYLNDEKTLGIVLDTANKERIDGDYKVCDEIIKIDHHIIVDNYGDLNIVDENASSCSQIVTYIYSELKEYLTLNIKAAEALFKGIVGDSNRFLYRHTDERTFKMAALLVETGIDIESIYQQMYLRDKGVLEVTRFILNHYYYDSGVAYYILKDEDLQRLGISREEGSNYVNTLANIKEFKVWLAVTENKAMNNYRVSIRSRSHSINDIANQFHGGGHALASGATLDSLDELKLLIEKLKERVYE